MKTSIRLAAALIRRPVEGVLTVGTRATLLVTLTQRLELIRAVDRAKRGAALPEDICRGREGGA